MATSSIVVRPLSSPEEFLLQFQLSDAAFSQQPAPENVSTWKQFMIGHPDFKPEQLRGAFRGQEQLGGYILHEREMRLGRARISTGCIGMVVVHPQHRNQGVASALMSDAIQFARTRKHALLFLNGIPKFYHRYGYSDVIPLSTAEIERSAVLAQTPSSYIVRQATPDDAAPMLALYKRHFGPYTGSFVRSLEVQHYIIPRRAQPRLAIAPGGEVRGYIWNINGRAADEVAADDWEALLALLQYHARLPEVTNETGAPDTLQYRFPPSSPLLRWLVDSVEVPDTSHWDNPADHWSVRVMTAYHRYAGWMARLVHLPTLMQALLPELRERWRRSLASWRGEIVLTVGEEMYALRIVDGEIYLVDPANAAYEIGPQVQTVRLTPQAFTQMVFGYRTPSDLLQQTVNDEVLAVLSILFPGGHAWITRSDWF
jgi:GNAT superfamily N-acetyltransferase